MFDILDVGNSKVAIKNVDGHFIGGYHNINEKPCFVTQAKDLEHLQIIIKDGKDSLKYHIGKIIHIKTDNGKYYGGYKNKGDCICIVD